MQRSKIMMLLPSLNIGGAERSTIKLANALASDSHEVMLVVFYELGLLEDEIHSGVKVMFFGAQSLKGAIKKLIDLSKQSRYDYIITSLYSTSIAALIAKLFTPGLRVITVAHGSLSYAEKYPDNWKDRIIIPLYRRFLITRSDAIVGVSRGLVEELEAILPKDRCKIVHIPNAVVADAVFSLPNSYYPTDASSERKVKKIVSVGRLVREKRFDVLINSFTKVLDVHTATLTIVGSGPLLASLALLAEELQVREKVHFVVGVTDIFPILRESDLFVLASETEGLGNVIIEALSVGLPVVSTDCDYGPREILAHGDYGKLTRVNDVQDLALGISEALATMPTVEERSRLIQRSKLYTPGAISQSYLRLMKCLS